MTQLNCNKNKEIVLLILVYKNNQINSKTYKKKNQKIKKKYNKFINTIK